MPNVCLKYVRVGSHNRFHGEAQKFGTRPTVPWSCSTEEAKLVREDKKNQLSALQCG